MLSEEMNWPLNASFLVSPSHTMDPKPVAIKCSGEGWKFQHLRAVPITLLEAPSEHVTFDTIQRFLIPRRFVLPVEPIPTLLRELSRIEGNPNVINNERRKAVRLHSLLSRIFYLLIKTTCSFSPSPSRITEPKAKGNLRRKLINFVWLSLIDALFLRLSAAALPRSLSFLLLGIFDYNISKM